MGWMPPCLIQIKTVTDSGVSAPFVRGSPNAVFLLTVPGLLLGMAELRATSTPRLDKPIIALETTHDEAPESDGQSCATWVAHRILADSNGWLDGTRPA